MERPDETECQNPEVVRDILLSLTEGMEILVNGRPRPLELVASESNNPEPGYHRLVFAGRGTTYRVIIDPEQTFRPELKTEGGSSTSVDRIEFVDGETYLVSDTSVSDLLSEPGDWKRESVKEEHTVTFGMAEPSGERLGACPSCGSDVTEDGERVVCTGCVLWCWISEWETYQTQH